MAKLKDRDAPLPKPKNRTVSLDIEECQGMIELADEKNLILMVAHVLRFMPPYQKLKSYIQNKEFGSLKFLSMTRFSGVPLWGEWMQKQSAFGSSGVWPVSNPCSPSPIALLGISDAQIPLTSGTTRNAIHRHPVWFARTNTSA